MPKLIESINTLDNQGGSKKLTDYGGGLNTADSNEVLRDNEAIVRQNWSNVEKGALKRVNGFTKKNSTAIDSAAIRGLFRVYQANGTRKLLAIVNTKLYFSDNDGTNFSAATGGTGLSATKFNTGVNFNDLFFFSNDTNNLQHYTPGTNTMAAATSQPNDPCEIILKKVDKRMLALVNTINSSTLYFTKIAPNGTDANDWSKVNDAGSIAIDGSKSEALTGGMTFGAVDIIFKDKFAFKVWGYPNPISIKLAGSPGCAAPRSVAQGDGLGFFLGHDAIWMYDGNKFIEISKPIQPIVDAINPSQVRNAFGVYRKGLYRLFYTKTGQTTNQSVIIYDVKNSRPYQGINIWYERPGQAMNCPVIFKGRGDANEIYAGDSSATGFVYRLDFAADGGDNTNNIQAVHQTKYFDMGFPHLVKRFTKIHFKYFSAIETITVEWFTNRGATTGSFTIPVTQTGVKLDTFLLDTDTLASTVESSATQRLPDNAVGKDISIKITHNAKGTSSIIRDIEIEWEALFIP